MEITDLKVISHKGEGQVGFRAASSIEVRRLSLSLTCLLKDRPGEPWPKLTPSTLVLKNPLVSTCDSWDETRRFAVVSAALHIQVSALNPPLLTLATQAFFRMGHLISLWASRPHPPAHTLLPWWPFPGALLGTYNSLGSVRSEGPCPHAPCLFLPVYW